MRIGVLTAGGDCPGLNAVIRSVTHRGITGHGDEIIGFEDGFKGLLEGRFRPLDLNSVSGILARGGTILGSARLERARLHEAADNVAALQADHGIDVLIPIGGEGTLTAARMLSDAGMPVVGVPKTIDNDISATDRTFGFDTAVTVATEAIDRLKTTAESHQRVMVVEVMGRHAGWIALESGMAGGAHAILLPERPFDPADICAMVDQRFQRGKKFAVVCVAEGAHPIEGTMPYGHGEIDPYGHERFIGIGTRLADELAGRLGKEAKPVILGHVQRGGVPTAYDRVLATRFGWHAVEAAHKGAFGSMTALRGNHVELVPLRDAITVLKRVPPDRMEEAESVF
ncbi:MULTISPECIES: ATP-dependent 6-phosphofructokinase [Streptomycetaceae]|uniref:ATP-dependent 6-phosphofructokinase n=1 Tax=Streptantibioticus cattleyicolor (strain ATCC 35852 / DSM 46488 / JCM 4925 / NBRC 14057 / NRRL 8057) TaxID=1003195 RepID=F8JQD6_STREN|nr:MULTISPECIES: ATP-dependent 6-phosphofructokinase [Streptomycetaceae]AEW96605.1 6-phosphofructokinase [Streptantibioticus cattleyicolor NRRL 8057 = DSM 46488]MYS61101.1 ATP-dependent 6-phosphofructokinase [Streptomyces sp. SID5468]CCB76943.1 6-phosphofructokinase [Streptantibioticus cattleyicolor NRRL 8057 = DSM 46488]